MCFQSVSHAPPVLRGNAGAGPLACRHVLIVCEKAGAAQAGRAGAGRIAWSMKVSGGRMRAEGEDGGVPRGRRGRARRRRTRRCGPRGAIFRVARRVSAPATFLDFSCVCLI